MTTDQTPEARLAAALLQTEGFGDEDDANYITRVALAADPTIAADLNDAPRYRLVLREICDQTYDYGAASVGVSRAVQKARDLIGWATPTEPPLKPNRADLNDAPRLRAENAAAVREWWKRAAITERIKTLPYVHVKRMTSRFVALDDVVGLLDAEARALTEGSGP